jgi:hypothetical protein
VYFGRQAPLHGDWLVKLPVEASPWLRRLFDWFAGITLMNALKYENQ